jgi:hypothetical protein
MFKKKQAAGKKSKNVFIYIFVIALILVISSLSKNIYDITVATVKNVNRNQYIFANQETSEIKGIVKIIYTDEQGNEISTSDTITGTIGEEYETSRKEISGYKAYGNDPINKIGNYDDIDVTVNYIYQGIDDEVKTTSDGTTVTVEIIKENEVENKEVKLSIVTEDEDGNNIRGAKYEICNSNEDVVRIATSHSNKLIVGSLTINEKGTDLYNIKQSSAPNGYETIENKIGVSIAKTYDELSDTYSFSASIDDNDNATVSVNEDSSEIIVTVVNKKKTEETEEPADPENPDETEDKIFDLEINKSVYEVQVNVGDSTIIKKKDGDKLLKIDIPKSKIEGATIKVIYEIEVKNVGEIAGYATELRDYIPDDMTAVESEAWSKLGDDIAVSNKFENTLLNPGDTVTTYITCKYNLSEDNIGLKTNKAVIYEYYNDEDIQDNTPDNESEEPVLITIKTGSKSVITIETLIALILVGGIVYMIKKRK